MVLMKKIDQTSYFYSLLYLVITKLSFREYLFHKSSSSDFIRNRSRFAHPKIEQTPETMPTWFPSGNGDQAERFDFLCNLYLRLNQGAYGILALPIGTVLCIAPLYLNIQLSVPITTIGYMMGGGELLGTIAMKISHLTDSSLSDHMICISSMQV